MMIVISNVNDTQPAPARILQTADDGTISVRLTVESEGFISAGFALKVCMIALAFVSTVTFFF